MLLRSIKHSLDNALHDLWDSMAQKDEFMSKLRSMEIVLRQPSYRDKLRHLFFSHGTELDEYASHRLRHWGSSLKSLRWHAVINFLRELKMVQERLQERWNLKIWLSSIPKERCEGTEHVGEGRGPAGAATYKAMDSAIRSTFFWCFADLMLEVSSTAETLSRWVETCFYHGRACSEHSCVNKGCKAPELACGIHKFLLKEIEGKSNAFISNAIQKLSAEEAKLLLADWRAAHARLKLELSFKLHYWDLFPYKLCGCAATCVAIAKVIAQQCLQKWETMTQRQQRHSHPMTRMFLDPSWAGVDQHFGGVGPADKADPPLCEDLLRFAEGAGVDDLTPNFRVWLEALARIRVHERGVEGIHASVTQSLGGGRPLSAPGLSCELKWRSFEDVLQKTPHDIIFFIQSNEQLCTWKGLKDGVEGLLGCTGLQLGGKDQYGELGNFLHRLRMEQQ